MKPVSIALFLAAAIQSLWAQNIPHDLRDTLIQADYVFVCPSEYVQIAETLGAFRASHDGFNVAIATTDSIYSQFGQGIPPDSAIREFVTFALTAWEEPPPGYFILAGNVNTVPSHKEPGIQFINEDSIMVDQWLVEGVEDTIPYRQPAAAIGRLPAWNASQLFVMVSKIIGYETTVDSGWVSTSIAVADYAEEYGSLFEDQARALQQVIATSWVDTVNAHVREDSPLHLTREQFRAAVNAGAAMVSLIGYSEWYFFSQTEYFTTWDVDSLSNANALSFWMIEESQRFEEEETLAVAVNLLQASQKGSVAVLAPTGHIFANAMFMFMREFFEQMVSDPSRPVGKALLEAKRNTYEHPARIMALLGDPALIIKNPFVSSVIDPPGGLPDDFTLYQNFPNPFNSETNIRIVVPRSSHVNVTVYDVLGRQLATFGDEVLPAETYTYRLDSRNLRLSTGAYLCVMTVDGFRSMRKMVLLR